MTRSGPAGGRPFGGGSFGFGSVFGAGFFGAGCGLGFGLKVAGGGRSSTASGFVFGFSSLCPNANHPTAAPAGASNPRAAKMSSFRKPDLPFFAFSFFGLL